MVGCKVTVRWFSWASTEHHGCSILLVHSLLSIANRCHLEGLHIFLNASLQMAVPTTVSDPPVDDGCVLDIGSLAKCRIKVKARIARCGVGRLLAGEDVRGKSDRCTLSSESTALYSRCKHVSVDGEESDTVVGQPPPKGSVENGWRDHTRNHLIATVATIWLFGCDTAAWKLASTCSSNLKVHA